VTARPTDSLLGTKVTVGVSCVMAGGVLGSLWVIGPGLGVILGLAAAYGALKGVRVVERRAMVGRPLPTPEHRLVLAGAACLIEDLGWSPAAPHGRTDNQRAGICTLAAIQRSAGMLMQAGLVSNPRAAAETNDAYGRWLEAHGHSRYGWTTHDNPRLFNDTVYSDQYVIGLARQAAGVPAGGRVPAGFVNAPAMHEWGPMFQRAARDRDPVPRRHEHGGAR